MNGERATTYAYQPFRARTVACDGRIRANGFELRTYAVNADEDRSVSVSAFEEGVRLALLELPLEREPGCPGAGFIIRHRGVAANYVVLAWWTNENELPTRVFVTDSRTGQWRLACRESFCVWDLEIIWEERNHYIATVLGGTCDISRYVGEVPRRFVADAIPDVSGAGSRLSSDDRDPQRSS